jgi:diguanylate cyclase (GGDEF)-like protein
MGRASISLHARLGMAAVAVAGLSVFTASLLALLREATPPVAALCVSLAALLGLAAWRLPWGRLVERGAAARVGDLEALVGAVALLQAEHEPRRIADLIARLGAAVLHADEGVVFLRDATGSLTIAGRHESADPATPPLAPTASVVVGAAATGGVAGSRDPRPFADGRPRWLLSIPLVGAVDRSNGIVVLSGDAAGRCDDPFAAHLSRLFGFHAGLALERLRVIERLSDEVMRDPLTGVGNRRRASELIDSLREGDALIVVDLDRFKVVNDTDGHEAGDAVLASLGRYLAQSLRDDDGVARYGGDEFIVVLRNAGDGARAAAQRLVAGWRSSGPAATFSAGVAVHDGGDAPRTTMRRADASMYAAKRAGRDRVLPFAERVVRTA